VSYMCFLGSNLAHNLRFVSGEVLTNRRDGSRP
jgi:hypothetical protein